MNRQPSSRQLEYLRFIAAYTARRGVAPSFEEIGAHFLVSAPSVNNMIKTLEARGFLTRAAGAARSLRVRIALDPRPQPATQKAVDPRPSADESDAAELLQLARLVVNRLPQALRANDQRTLWAAFDAVSDALDVQMKDARMTDAERERALAALADAARAAEQAWNAQPRVQRRMWTRVPR